MPHPFSHSKFNTITMNVEVFATAEDEDFLIPAFDILIQFSAVLKVPP